jgi:hypothetical protein
MTYSTKTNPQAIASLNLPTTVSALLTYAEGIVDGMKSNPSFPTPTPPLATVTAAIDALSSAEKTAQTRAKGTAAPRNVARTTLVTLLKQLKGYVQTVADGDPENSEGIITSARMAVRKAPVRKPRVFGAEPGPTTGTAKLVAASAGARAAYEWEYSTDGGHTWVAAPPTMQAKTVVTGLPAGTAVQFRYRTVTKVGAADWSAAVTLLVK